MTCNTGSALRCGHLILAANGSCELQLSSHDIFLTSISTTDIIPSLLRLTSLRMPSSHTRCCFSMQAHALIAVADCNITSPATGDRVAEGIVVQVGVAMDRVAVMHHTFRWRLLWLLSAEEAML